MASTIIIKNGDGTSVPSSLKQGEFAINVDNGFLYYGTSGSSNEVSSGWQFGAVTSSGNVSASGDIAGNSLTINAEGVSKASISDAGIITGTGFTIGNAAIVEAELETIDGVTAGTVAANKAVVVDSNKDIGSFRNITLTGELDAGSLDVSGDVDIDGTLEADAITIDGVTLAETIADTVGAMVTSNTESGITVAYDDSDNTLDFTVGTLNQNTTGTAATVTTAAQTNITSLGTLTALTVDGEVSMTTLDIGGTNVTSTAAELNILDGVTSTASELNALDGITAVVVELNALDLGSLPQAIPGSGTAIANKAVILDSSKDYTGIRNFTITGNLEVGGTTTQVNTVTMNAQNAVVFEGATADAHETTLTIVDPTADHIVKIPDLGNSATTAFMSLFAADPGTTTISSTPAELNILDGVTSTTAELNILDGVTSTAAELNILDGVTSTAAELNILDGVTSTAAELNILDGVTSTAAELNVLDGITAVVGELNALDIGATAVGTAVASKAVILDSSKDYTGIRNLTVSGDLDSGRLVSGGDGALTFDAQSSIKMIDNNARALVIEVTDTAYMTFVTSDGNELIDFNAEVVTSAGINITSGLRIDGTGVSSTAAELNILDGVTSTAAELNILDGVTSTAAELNILDGVTSTTAELNILDGVTSTAAELNILDGVTSTAAELNILDGVTSTAAELNILDGVTSTTAELNILDGVTSTTAELNYVDGVTSAIQTQIDTKSPTASPTFTGTPAAPTPAASTDSTQIATTAYVKDQYSYQYISFFGAVSAANNNNGGPYYIFPSGNGISNHSWTKYDVGTALAITEDTIDLATDANCSQLDISTYNGANQIVVPQTSEIVGFYATNRSIVNGPYHVGNAIFVIPESGVNWGDSTSMTAFLKYRSISSAHSGTDENFSNSNVNTTKLMMCKDMARGTYEVAAGSIIVPAIFCDTHSQAFASSMTIVTRTKIQS
jgi:hypothetical protein